MPRANRHHIPGCVWHITHRCHKREFLLKFARDRRRWMRWLYEARKRFRLSILDFMVTCNHIHLLVVDGDNPSSIPRSLQLIEGRTAQEYNLRKRRRGAFWEDRYHATAIQSGKHLAHCMRYIDMNMVRAGAVHHPSEWEWCGYTVIQNPPARYRLIDYDRAAELLGLSDVNALARQQRMWVDEALRTGKTGRDSKWTESIAVGERAFAEDILEKLGARAGTRSVIGEGDTFAIKEHAAPYRPVFEGKIEVLRPENTYLWNVTG